MYTSTIFLKALFWHLVPISEDLCGQEFKSKVGWQSATSNREHIVLANSPRNTVDTSVKIEEHYLLPWRHRPGCPGRGWWTNCHGVQAGGGITSLLPVARPGPPLTAAIWWPSTITMRDTRKRGSTAGKLESTHISSWYLLLLKINTMKIGIHLQKQLF